MASVPCLNLPVNINNRKYDEIRKYFEKYSIQRHLRDLSNESVYSKEEIAALKRQKQLVNKDWDEDEQNEKPRYGTSKEFLAFYLEEDKKRRFRELLNQARILRTIETNKVRENITKQALDQKMKREIVEKVRNFDTMRLQKNSDRSLEAMAKKREQKPDGSDGKAGNSKGEMEDESRAATSGFKSTRFSTSALSKQTGKSSVKSSRKEFDDLTPRKVDNLEKLNFTDYCGLPIPKDVDIFDIDNEYLREAIRELIPELEDEESKIDEVVGLNRPQTQASGSKSQRSLGSKSYRSSATKSARLDSEYFGWVSVPAVRNISRSFQTSVRTTFTPRDFGRNLNVCPAKLRPVDPATIFKKTPETLPKIKLTREKIRYPPHPPKSHMKENQSSNVKLTLMYNGMPTTAVGVPEEGHKLEVVHQPGKGTSYTIFTGHVVPGNTFDIVSKRIAGQPFSITLFIQGYADTRVSTCCEFRHKAGFKIGGSLGRFTIEKITGDRELRCYKCKIIDFENMPKLKKLIVQDGMKSQPKKEEDRKSNKSSGSSGSRSSKGSDDDQEEEPNADETLSSRQDNADNTIAGGQISDESRTSADAADAAADGADAAADDGDTAADDGAQTNYKVTLVATNLELARDSNLILTVFGSKKRCEKITLTKPFQKVMKMNVHHSFLGERIGNLSKLVVETDPSHGADWFLKEVAFDYGGTRTLFTCEKWIGISDEGMDVFTDAKTTQLHETGG